MGVLINTGEDGDVTIWEHEFFEAYGVLSEASRYYDAIDNLQTSMCDEECLERTTIPFALVVVESALVQRKQSRSGID